MDQSEEQIEVVLTIHVTLEDEYVDLDKIVDAIRADDQFKQDLEFAFENMMEEHRTDRIGHRPLDDACFAFTEGFIHLWNKGFGVEARADAWRRAPVDDDQTEWEEF